MTGAEEDRLRLLYARALTAGDDLRQQLAEREAQIAALTQSLGDAPVTECEGVFSKADRDRFHLYGRLQALAVQHDAAIAARARQEQAERDARRLEERAASLRRLPAPFIAILVAADELRDQAAAIRAAVESEKER